MTTRRTGREHGLLVDADAGDQLGRDVPGDRTSIDLGELLPFMRGGDDRYLVAHTHPSDRPFNRHDVMALFRYRAVRVIAVFGAHGSWFLMSRAAEQMPSPDEMVARYDEVLASIRQEYARRVQHGQVSPVAADRAALHAIWSQIADGLGLRYTRLRHG